MAITSDSESSARQQQQADGAKGQPSQHSSANQLNLNPGSINFDECLQDSPNFRHNLKENLNYTEHLEYCMQKSIKQVANFIETGKDHIKAQRDFIQSIKTLNNALEPNSKRTSKHLNTLLESFEEISRLNEILIDQSARTVGSHFSRFINDDLVKLRDARKSFDKISHEYDQALVKYSQPVRKQQEDSENLLIATSTAFTHTSLDLSIQMTTLQAKKGFEILDSLLSFARAYSTYFHQGFDLFEDLKPHITDMDEHLSSTQDEFETLTRNLPSKHLMVSNNELKPLSFDSSAQIVHLEGYLFKRASNGFKVWHRRWFILKNHKLAYQKRGDLQPIVMEEDLRLLTVRSVDKADTERRFCFEVVSPQKSHILQADSESACKTWISAIQAGINAAFHDTEHQNEIKIPEHNDHQSSTSWSSNFSLKALHQQATSKLNSFTNISEISSKSHGAGKSKLRNRSGSSASVDGDENSSYDANTKLDEQGRFYAPLRDDDADELNDQVDAADTKACDGATYPAARSESNGRTTNDKLPVAAASAPEKPQRAYMIILSMPGNDRCADCEAHQPRWASINLGITLCIECAGIHRSLGVHLSKVRSLTLDTEVWSPEIVQLMLSLGNIQVNSAYMACYRNQLPLINAESSREERENFIRSKYCLKTFMRPPGFNLDDSTNSIESEVNKTVVAAEPQDEASLEKPAPKTSVSPQVEKTSSTEVSDLKDCQPTSDHNIPVSDKP